MVELKTSLVLLPSYVECVTFEAFLRTIVSVYTCVRLIDVILMRRHHILQWFPYQKNYQSLTNIVLFNRFLIIPIHKPIFDNLYILPVFKKNIKHSLLVGTHNTKYILWRTNKNQVYTFHTLQSISVVRKKIVFLCVCMAILYRSPPPLHYIFQTNLYLHGQRYHNSLQNHAFKICLAVVANPFICVHYSLSVSTNGIYYYVLYCF